MIDLIPTLTLSSSTHQALLVSLILFVSSSRGSGAGEAFGPSSDPTLSASEEPGRSTTSPVEIPAPPRAILERIRDAALGNTYALDQVAYLSRNIGARFSGTPGAAAAVDYVREQMEAEGFSVTLQEVMVPRWIRGTEKGVLVDWPGRRLDCEQEVILTTLGGSIATPDEGIVAEVLVVESFEDLESRNREAVEGRIVLFNPVFDKALTAQGRAGDAYDQVYAYRSQGAIAASKQGARAALVRSLGSADFRLPHTGGMRYEEGVAPIPAAAVSAEDASTLASLARQGPVSMRLILTPRSLDPIPGHNVIADFVGSTHPEEIVLVSGHLDSWDICPGAIDDASGVAMAMATLKIVKDLGLKPRRTLRCVAWMNEENGMAGARGYVDAFAGSLARHRLAIESDFGVGHPIGIDVHAPDALVDSLGPALAVARRFGAGLIERHQEPVSTDVSFLGAKGVPTLELKADTRDYFHYHHTRADTFDKIDPQFLAENVALMAVLAGAIAGF